MPLLSSPLDLRSCQVWASCIRLCDELKPNIDVAFWTVCIDSSIMAAEGVAIISGGTSYLGAAAARSLAPTHAIAITDLAEKEQEGRKIVAELGEDRAVWLECDVRHELSDL